ncbi:MAG TPA: hemerythrin domain-containing protein [Actinomycetota bacterium]|nr:hemerythrin domain-containing protein [Actinomycetota bacterium]
MSPSPDLASATEGMWCGRSWEALAERRAAAGAQALALRNATPSGSRDVVSEFLEFFDTTGAGLFRDEEQWVFRAVRPTPKVVIRALEEHITITSLIGGLVLAAEAGCVDLRVVHHLGGLLDDHLALEESEVRPLVVSRPLGFPPLRLASP